MIFTLLCSACGTNHPAKQFQTRWRDFKSKAKTKNAELKRVPTGGGPPGEPLSKLESDFLDFMRERGSSLIDG